MLVPTLVIPLQRVFIFFEGGYNLIYYFVPSPSSYIDAIAGNIQSKIKPGLS